MKSQNYQFGWYYQVETFKLPTNGYRTEGSKVKSGSPSEWSQRSNTARTRLRTHTRFEVKNVFETFWHAGAWPTTAFHWLPTTRSALPLVAIGPIVLAAHQCELVQSYRRPSMQLHELLPELLTWTSYMNFLHEVQWGVSQCVDFIVSNVECSIGRQVMLLQNFQWRIFRNSVVESF